MGDVYVKLLSGRGDAFARIIRIFAQHSGGTVLFQLYRPEKTARA